MVENTAPIRVLCVFALLDRGGAESMCMELYRHIDRQKIQFDFVKHTSEKGIFEDEITSFGGKIYEAPKYKIYNHFSYCKWWKNHLKQHPEHKIIHGHFFTISSVYFKVAKKINRITVAHSHNTSISAKGVSLSQKIKLKFIKKIEKYSDYFLACSKPAGSWLFPNSKYSLLNNAIDTSLFKYNETVVQTIRDEFNFSKSDFIICHVGRFFSQKNHTFLIDIFNEIHKRDRKYKLLLIGDGELRTEIEKKVLDLELNNYVTFAGVRSDVNHIMMASDAFVLPSLFEGLPVVAIEAQTSGLPCFISDTVTNEVILTKNCHMLPLGDTNYWADTIINTPPTTTRDMTKEIIDAGYDIHSTSKWLQDFYISILKH